MRIHVHAISLNLSSDLRGYVEDRIRQTTRRWARRVPLVRVWLVNNPDESRGMTISCRLDAWVRTAGIVTVRHFDDNWYVAIDVAAARLAQAIAQRLRLRRRSTRRVTALVQDDARFSASEKQARRPRRLAVVIERAGLPQRLALVPWLKASYGIEQIMRVSLPPSLWRCAAEDSSLARALRDRMRHSLLCWPELIVVLGRAGSADDAAAIESERANVRQIVARLREEDTPVETVGLWIIESWYPDCRVESLELDRLQPRAALARRDHCDRTLSEVLT